MKKNMKRLTAALITVMIVAFAAVTASADFSYADSTITNPEASFVNTAAAYQELNVCRSLYNQTVNESKHIKMLKRDSKLEKIAMTRAQEMAETGAFSHTRPNGKSGLSLIKGNKAKGENLAKGQTTCEEVTAAWYASPEHRKNMLRKNFTKVGIAGYTVNGVTYWAQVFSS